MLINDDVMGKSNCIIPLYIHSAHWSISKEYLNPICNIILHNSLNIDHTSAWKLIYCFMIDLGGMMFDKTKRIKSVKYFFSLWLTTYVLSKENYYDTGLNNFLTKIRAYDEECNHISNIDGTFIKKTMIEQTNVDPSMIAGQIISTGYMINHDNLKFIKHLIIKTRFDEIKLSILNDNIYEDVDLEIDKDMNHDSVKDMKIPKKIIADRLIHVMRDQLYVELYRVIFLDVFTEMFKKKNAANILASNLKNTFGIPTDKLIMEFFKILDQTDVDKKINEMICTTKFDDDKIDTVLNNYINNISVITQ
jgi:hypothetical protein